MKRLYCLLSLIAVAICLSGCAGPKSNGASVGEVTKDVVDSNNLDNHEDEKSEKIVGERNASPKVLIPQATQEVLYENKDVSIDASNMTDGYVCVAYKGDAKKVRMLIETPAQNTYNYLMDLDGLFDVYPLSEGSGNYKIGVYENIRDDQYTLAFSQTITVQLKDEYTTFLYPNAYVDFNEDSNAVKKASELAQTADTDLDLVEKVYHYVAQNVAYDYDKAETVQSGYIPIVDETLATGKGICFDYASLMGAMLRSQGIPTRLDIGYAGTEYHAWISVYIQDVGWVDDIIYFDGKEWILMDPTLASYAKEKVIKEHWESDSYYQLVYKY